MKKKGREIMFGYVYTIHIISTVSVGGRGLILSNTDGICVTVILPPSLSLSLW